MNEKIWRIVAPVTGAAEVEPLIKSGAGELYFGYLAPQWIESFGCFTGNRREFKGANLTELSEVSDLIDSAHTHECKVALTLNDRYTESQYEDLLMMTERVVERGVDAIIVADVGVLCAIRDRQWSTEIHISTSGGVFNASTAKFFGQLGAKRIILPRQVTVKEIEDIATANQELDFEVFGIYGRDPFIDSFCRFHHGIDFVAPGLGKCGCMRINASKLSMSGGVSGEEDLGSPFKILNCCKVDGCSACNLPLIKSLNVNAIKVVGRGAPLKRKLEGIRMIKQSLETSSTNSHLTHSDACRKIFNEVFMEPCRPENCYLQEQVD